MVLYPNKLPESERVCSGICNYYRIKNEVRQIVADEIERIKADPELSHLIKDK